MGNEQGGTAEARKVGIRPRAVLSVADDRYRPAQIPPSRWGVPRVDPEEDYFDKEEETPAPNTRQTRTSTQKRGRSTATTGIGTRRAQRPANVAIPRVYPIGGSLVDYQEEEEAAEGGASPPSPEPKQEPKPQDGTRLRGHTRRPDLQRNATVASLSPNTIERSQDSSPVASTSASANDQLVNLSPSTSSRRSPSEIGPVPMEEDDDLIGPPVSLSHKRRREAEEDDDSLERLSKRPTLSHPTTSSSPERTQDAKGDSSAAGLSMDVGTPSPETNRSSKRQLRVRLGNASLAQAQPPDVKVGDKG